VVKDKEWDWCIEVLTDQNILLDLLTAIWGSPSQFREISSAVVSQARTVKRQFRS
jgi:hypothetical protein